MAIPNNETFSMQDVATEVGTVLNWNLITAAAIPGGFDPAYNQDSYAPANSLLRFRNYTHIITITPVIEVNTRTVSNTTINFRVLLDSPTSSILNINISRTNTFGNNGTGTSSIRLGSGSSSGTSAITTDAANNNAYTALMTITDAAPAGYVFASTTASINVPAI